MSFISVLDGLLSLFQKASMTSGDPHDLHSFLFRHIAMRDRVMTAKYVMNRNISATSGKVKPAGNDQLITFSVSVASTA
jgi:hypothetical protein